MASVKTLKQTLVRMLNAAMTQSFVLSDCKFTRTKIEAMGSSDARIHVIHDVTFKTVES